MRDGEEAAREVRVAHVGVVARLEDVKGDAVVGGDEAAELDLDLEYGASHVLGLDRGVLEVEAEGYGGVGDAVDERVAGLKGRGVERSGEQW